MIKILVPVAIVAIVLTVAFLWPVTIWAGIAILFGMMVFAVFHEPKYEPMTKEDEYQMLINSGMTPEEAKDFQEWLER